MNGKDIENKWSIDLHQALDKELPPSADKLITYTIEAGALGGRVLHSTRCAQTRKLRDAKLAVQRTTAQELRQALADDGITRACQYCGTHEHVRGLVQSIKPYNRDKLCWADYAMLLYFEAWKTGNEEAWTRWLCEKSVAQLQKEAQETLEWNKHPDGKMFVCLDAHPCSEGSWMIGAGDHVCVRRRRGLSNVVLHGLVPEHVAQPGAGESTKIFIPVDRTFTKAHLNLAVSLYEEQDIGVNRGATVLRGVAQAAVETAWLCTA